MSRFVFLVALLLPASAFAALDDVIPDDASVVHQGAMRVRTQGKVTDFADDKGRVFATRWKGFGDSRAMLGSHYAAFQAALAQAKHGLHFVHVKTNELEVSVVSYGRLRETTAVLIKQLPAGVTAHALR